MNRFSREGYDIVWGYGRVICYRDGKIVKSAIDVFPKSEEDAWRLAQTSIKLFENWDNLGSDMKGL